MSKYIPFDEAELERRRKEAFRKMWEDFSRTDIPSKPLTRADLEAAAEALEAREKEPKPEYN